MGKKILMVTMMMFILNGCSKPDEKICVNRYGIEITGVIAHDMHYPTEIEESVLYLKNTTENRLWVKLTASGHRQGEVTLFYQKIDSNTKIRANTHMSRKLAIYVYDEDMQLLGFNKPMIPSTTKQPTKAR